jgi:hypothetical protein
VRCQNGQSHLLRKVFAVIADSNSAADSATPAVETLPEAELSATELYQLTLYKWRYSLEAFGFDDREVRDLMFLKWLYASRRILL